MRLEICEMDGTNIEDEQQLEMFNASEFFNPVDLVCFTKDFKDDKFKVMDHINENQYLISEKKHEGILLILTFSLANK